MSKLATLSVVSKDGKPSQYTDIFNIENIYYPIYEEDGKSVLLVRSIRESKIILNRFLVSDTLSEILSKFNDTTTAASENVGLISLTVRAVGTEFIGGVEHLFTVSNIAAPCYSVNQIVLSDGSLLAGEFSALPILYQNTLKIFYVDESLDDIELAANENPTGSDRSVQLYTYWRDYRVNKSFNNDVHFPAWLLYPVNLIEFPIENNSSYAKPGEPNGIVINVKDLSLDKKIPYKVASSLENLFEILTTPSIGGYYDIVNGSAPQLFYP